MFNFLKNEIENSFLSNFELYHSTTGDGRLDSAESEIVIIEHLKSLIYIISHFLNNTSKFCK